MQNINTDTINNNIMVHDLPLTELHEDIEFNCRGEIKPIDVAAMVKDIRENGLLQPITVRTYDEFKKQKTGFPYGIVAGFNRYNAFKILQYPTIPCIIKYGMNDIDARFTNLRENIIRKDINIVQEAKSIQHLKTAGVKQTVIAERLGKSNTWVNIRFAVLNFPEDIQEECAAGTLNQNQILAVSSLPRIKQYEAVRELKDKRIRGEKGTLSIKRPLNYQSKRARNRAEINAMLEHIMDNLGPSFTTRVIAWIAGNISSSELYADIREEMTKEGKFYTMPQEELL